MAVVVLLGDINIDLVLDIPAYPDEGGEAIATRQTVAIGGSATNTAIALARSGHEARMIGRIGDDAWGREAFSDLSAAGVVTDWIGTDPSEPTQVNVVTVGTSGERTMFAYRGANARLAPETVADDAFEAASLFHLSGYALLQAPQSAAARRAIDLAAAQNIPVSLDIPGGVVATIATDVFTLLPKLDTIMLDSADLPRLLHRPQGSDLEPMVAALLAGGVRRIALKGNGALSLLSHQGGTDSAPWFTVDVTDTTGAGDAFAAGHIHGRLAGLGGHDCCRLANAFGAVAVTRKGAGLAMPSLEEALRLMDARTPR
ncbi:MAG TPA: carbohydrate kinase family protein [Shinella sp.]|jgi:ribokinase|uniref:carbohydrate kinase family protein n=1 Tax=Shinella sp. TaxID=1870904 RepID=UPI002E0D7F74|nr:carbohydrate kinase family protein [Shinella sp.]